MGVSLTKGGNVSLTKEAANSGAASFTKALVGLGWDANTFTGSEYDLDAQAIGVGADGKAISQDFFVFYSHLSTADGSILHHGDNLTGVGDGDDEQITVDLVGLPSDLQKVVFTVAIYEADTRKQSFGQVRNAYVRVLNPNDGAELARYDLTEDFSTETAIVFGELYRNGDEWKFRAVGQGYATGLAGIAADFGV